MARLLALCLFLIGLVAQSTPIVAEAMPAMHDGSAMVAMADCADCPEGMTDGSDACPAVGACAAGAAALDINSPDWAFVSSIREVRRVFGDVSRTGGRPAPLLEPPRRLV
ncbi:hypothetical protein [Limimaricola pyoseonensis]|uniref:hypothetical protein n=1 Tax=Limimaricola pyoseonensis TaxID=521013 RepID=UPI0010427433|nr:hypothetical protein [Limimaricola pyoseonensis]